MARRRRLTNAEKEAVAKQEAERAARKLEAASQPANLGGYVAPRGSVNTSVSLRIGDFEINLGSHRDY